MRGKDPKSKAVVFSSWGRLLSLIGEALKANGIAHVSLAGTQPEGRANALRTFLNDPDVSSCTADLTLHISLMRNFRCHWLCPTDLNAEGTSLHYAASTPEQASYAMA